MITPEDARARLRAIYASWEWAFACGSPCVVGRRYELDALRREADELRAIVKEHTP
jgi:hypothetical protein